MNAEEPWYAPPPPTALGSRKARVAAGLALAWIGGLGSLAAVVLATLASNERRTHDDDEHVRPAMTVGTFGILLTAGLIVAGVVANDRNATPDLAGAAPSTVPVATPGTTRVATTATSTAATTAAPTSAFPTCPPAAGAPTRQTRFNSEPPTCIDASKTYSAEITTNLGSVTVVLDAATAPVAVNNFVFLARWGFFDGTSCHRAIPGFMVQCGDPTATGRGGPGYTIRDELPAAGSYKIGSLAMANSGPDTSGSQFFIITGATGERLPASYTLFGQVTAGLSDAVPALDAAGNPDSAANGVPPKVAITITKVTITEQ